MTIMIQSQHSMKEKMFFMLFVFVGLSCIHAEPSLTTFEDPPVCDRRCGCDGMYRYDELKDECVLDLQHLMKKVEVRYDTHNTYDILAKDGMEKSIYLEGQKIFRGIMVSVILVIVCATICVLAACVYCCRIDFTDRKLKREVKTLAKTMNKTYKCQPTKSKVQEPKSQSCNVIVEDAGVFVV